MTWTQTASERRCFVQCVVMMHAMGSVPSGVTLWMHWWRLGVDGQMGYSHFDVREVTWSRCDAVGCGCDCDCDCGYARQ